VKKKRLTIRKKAKELTPRAQAMKLANQERKSFKAPEIKRRFIKPIEKPIAKSASTVNPGKLVQEIHEALKAGNIDPLLKQSLMIAIGDVVGLGYMTQEELEQEAEYDTDGVEFKKAGQALALEMVPTYIRAQMLKEITPYYLAKKKEVAANGIMEENLKVTFYIPENGRDKK
jgi:hypothetical protein